MSEKQDLINSAEDVAERAWIFYTAVREAGSDVLEATFLMRQYIIETMITSMHSKDRDTFELARRSSGASMHRCGSGWAYCDGQCTRCFKSTITTTDRTRVTKRYNGGETNNGC